MKFLVDECVGPAVARWLKKSGFDAISIFDVLTGIDDDAVLNKAFAESRILITSDKDFGEMVFNSNKQHCGILLLRLADERPSSKIEVIERLLKGYSEELFGNFVVATGQTVRIVHL